MLKLLSPTKPTTPAAFLKAEASWRPQEVVFWILALAILFISPNRAALMNEIAILALFALSIDLILGYAGIVSLGQAAFFGLGAYTAGLLAKHGVTEPITGLVIATLFAGLFGLLTSVLIIRGTDLTRLMVTLGVALILHEIANKADWLTGGADGLLGIMMGPILGLFAFDFLGKTAYLYSLTVLFLLFLLARRVVHSPFGLSLRAVKDNPLRASSVGISPGRRIVMIYTLAAAYAGAAGALLAQTTSFVSLEVLDFGRSADGLLVLVIGGTGYLYGGLVGAIAFKLMKDFLSGITPAYWLFWMGLFLVILVLVGRDRINVQAKDLLARLTGRRSA
ncbi:branched-chain amino acid ABC transporter permease [Phreatobacter aquaticus]|uniref:Branched-chain amino acid ABC transporter permease n=1 Tax=Phreatobacter aquaticus TaxID=2570229 RepID=A0A4D7QH28_9HYPH|nr:branched-chain amino acid ABC transporter permease [Phreatobacter aquaticus]QCK86195.1 branched-chain amino acid ABC transporter permease [Phreatobacter aquaticus]